MKGQGLTYGVDRKSKKKAFSRKSRFFVRTLRMQLVRQLRRHPKLKDAVRSERNVVEKYAVSNKKIPSSVTTTTINSKVSFLRRMVCRKWINLVLVLPELLSLSAAAFYINLCIVCFSTGQIFTFHGTQRATPVSRTCASPPIWSGCRISFSTTGRVSSQLSAPHSAHLNLLTCELNMRF